MFWGDFMKAIRSAVFKTELNRELDEGKYNLQDRLNDLVLVANQVECKDIVRGCAGTTGNPTLGYAAQISGTIAASMSDLTEIYGVKLVEYNGFNVEPILIVNGKNIEVSGFARVPSVYVSATVSYRIRTKLI